MGKNEIKYLNKVNYLITDFILQYNKLNPHQSVNKQCQLIKSDLENNVKLKKPEISFINEIQDKLYLIYDDDNIAVIIYNYFINSAWIDYLELVKLVDSTLIFSNPELTDVTERLKKRHTSKIVKKIEALESKLRRINRRG